MTFRTRGVQNAETGEMLLVGKLPGRKRVALFVQGEEDGVATIRPLAYFQSEAGAEELVRWFERIYAGRAP